jgi:hypothetical protein
MQVAADGSVGQVEPRRDLVVAQAACRKLGDMQSLRAEEIGRVGSPVARRLAGFASSSAAKCRSER